MNPPAVGSSLLALLLVAPAASAQLAPPVAPPENPVTSQKAVLGKILFWDEQLSSDNTVACGTCHRPEFGGGDARFVILVGPDGITPSPDDVFGSPGVRRAGAYNDYEPDAVHGFQPQATARSAPGNAMAGYHDELFWDGRASSTFVDPQTGLVEIATGGALESLSVVPIQSSIEMAHEARDWDEITTKLAVSKPMAIATKLQADVAAAIAIDPTYPDLFENAFGDPAITAKRIAFALASYQRTVLPDQTAWDDYNAGDNSALTSAQKSGLALFNGKANCSQCHPAPLFTDDTFRNIGLRDPATDPGRQAITGLYADRGKFKVASLRNVGLRPRYMHTGEQLEIEDVIDFYDRGGNFADNRDALIVPLNLTQQEKDDLADFVVNGLFDNRAPTKKFPFDRPTLWTDRTGFHPIVYGIGSAGSGGFVPQVLAPTPSNLGNWDFKMGVTNALGNSPAWAFVSNNSVPPGTNLKGLNLNVDLGVLLLVAATTTQGAGPGAGYATLAGELPNDPTLSGIHFYAQWIIVDAAGPIGLSSSAGVDFMLF